MFKCKKVSMLECQNEIKDIVMWWRGPMHKCINKCLKMSSHLNVGWLN